MIFDAPCAGVDGRHGGDVGRHEAGDDCREAASVVIAGRRVGAELVTDRCHVDEHCHQHSQTCGMHTTLEQQCIPSTRTPSPPTLWSRLS